MSTPEVGMSGLRCVTALRARGIGINRRWAFRWTSLSGRQAGFMPKSLVPYQADIGTLHEKNVIGFCLKGSLVIEIFHLRKQNCCDKSQKGLISSLLRKTVM